MRAQTASAVAPDGQDTATASSISLSTESKTFFLGLGALLSAMMLGFVGWYVYFAREVRPPTRTPPAHEAETRAQTGAHEGHEAHMGSDTAMADRAHGEPGIQSTPLPSSQLPKTQAQVVASFYGALSKGDGHGAAALVVPSKQGKEAFNASGMSRFYGAMKQPLQVHSLRQIDAQRLEVRYSYRVDKTTCEGTAIVTTEQVADRVMIRSIQANC